MPSLPRLEKFLPGTRSKIIAGASLLVPPFVYGFFKDLPASWLPVSDSEAFLWRLLTTETAALLGALATLASVLYDNNAQPDIKEILSEAKNRVRQQPSNGKSKDTVEGAKRVLSPDLCNLLVYLFSHQADLDRDVGAIAKVFGIQTEMARYNLDKLIKNGLAVVTGGSYVHGHVYFGLTDQGRAFVVENGLLPPDKNGPQ